MWFHFFLLVRIALLMAFGRDSIGLSWNNSVERRRYWSEKIETPVACLVE